MPDRFTEPKKDKAEQVADVVRDSILHQIKSSTDHNEVGSEDRKAEDAFNGALRKIIDKDKLKYRLQSSKNRQKVVTKGAFMSPPGSA